MPKTASTSKPVLIVEDNEVEREGLSAILRGSGFAVRGAATCEEGLEKLRLDPPGVVLLGMLFPGREMDGWSFLRRLLQYPPASRPPVIIVTGLGIATLEWARALGAVDVERRPVDTQSLLGKVAKYYG